MKKRNKKLWGALAAVTASLTVVVSGLYSIAMGQSAAINYALGISSSSVEYSDDEAYQYFKSDYEDYDSLQARFQEVAEQAEGEGLVLLRNDNDALPLAEGEKVSLVMTGSVHFNYSSSGSSAADTSGYKDLRTALEDEGFEVNETLWNMYSESSYGRTMTGDYYQINEMPYAEYTDEAIASIEDYGTVIVNFTRASGEGRDINAIKSDGEDGSYLSISAEEEEVLRELTAMKEEGKVSRIIVLLNSSATMELDFMFRDGIEIDACLWIGNVGKYGITSVAKVLKGEINPSGKLSDTWLRDNMSSPAMANQDFNAGKAAGTVYANYDSYELNATQMYYAVYVEGIYVGYRYYETRYTDYVNDTGHAGDYDYSTDVAYPFGYGLSYTTFEYSDMSMDYAEDTDTYTFTLTVTNTGDIDGKEAVQIYLQKPYTDYDIEHGVEKSAVELAGFTKTDSLAAGESQEVTVEVEGSRLRSYDANGYETYIVEEGDYWFTAANGAHEAANNILAAQGVTPDSTDGRMDAEGNADLALSITVDELDTETYAVSETGAAITNRLSDADLNKYEGSETQITYVSRSDWTGTWPSANHGVTLTDQMYEDLSSDKAYDEGDAQMPVYGEDNGLNIADLRGVSFDDEKWEKLLNQMTYAEQSYLITNGQMTTVVAESVGKPATAENDGPTGIINSQGGLSMPSEGIWASTFNLALIEEIGDILAEDTRAAGYNGIYANGINIHRTPFGGRSHEYFSEDSYLTAVAGAAEIRGLQNKGVIAHVKHIAFNEQEYQRNGLAMWLSEQEAREIMLLPFEYALSSGEGRGNAHAVMSSFTRVGTVWAGACSGLLEDIMRGEWGFDGYCITDMASSNGAFYMTYQDGVLNGTDLYLGSGSETALDAFSSSPAYAQAMRTACHRILYAVANYSCAMNGIAPESNIAAASWWWKTAIIAIWGVLLGLTVITGALYLLPDKKEKK